jgi:hypothetical protein
MLASVLEKRCPTPGTSKPLSGAQRISSANSGSALVWKPVGQLI